MKHFILFLLMISQYMIGFSQAKLIGRSGYNYNSVSNMYEFSDSSRYFYKTVNPTYSYQNIEDGYVSQQEDSSLQMGVNAGNPILNARVFFGYHPSYTYRQVYNDTIYGSGVPMYANHVDYYHNGTNYDSSISKQTTLATNTTITNLRTYYHQNALNLLDTMWYVYYNGSGAYSSTSKQTMVYNANNLTISTYSYSSTDSINYIPDTRIDYFYNIGNLLDSMVFFSYQAPSTWTKVAIREYTYNANSQKTMLIYKGFDQLSQQYQLVSRDVYHRTNGIQMDTLYAQLWNSGFSKYDTTVKRGLIYSNGLLYKLYSYTKDAITNAWIPDPYGSIQHYYYDIVQSLSNTQSKGSTLTLYPNPVSNELRILEDFTEATYSILSTDGKMIQHGILNAQQRISTESFIKGGYILILETEGQHVSRYFQIQ